MRKAVIVLPTYNEAKNIEHVINKIFEVSEDLKNWEIYVTVVDSTSPDNTGDIVKELGKKNKHLHLVSTEKEGLGKAYITGFRYVIDELKPAVIFEMDADLSHDPKKIPAFLEEIEKGADFVIGSRYMKGGAIPSDWGIHRKFMSVVGNWIIRLGFMNFKITEWTNGYRAIKTWLIQQSLPELENYTGYVFQVALLDNAIKSKARIVQIPIRFVDRKEGYSKIDSFQYIANALLYVLTKSSFVKFVVVGLTGFIIDFGIAISLITTTHIAKPVANMISAGVAVIANYMLNNFWSFRHKKVSGHALTHISTFIIFCIISIGSVLIQGGGLHLALNIFGDHTIFLGLVHISSWIIYKVGIIAFIIIPYSYFFYNKFVWKEK